MPIVLGRKPGGSGGGGAPSGPAGGSLTGTYPNPTIASGAIVADNIDATDAADIRAVLGLEDLAYTQFTSNVNITGTVTADVIVTASAVVLDGSTEIWVEAYSPDIATPGGDVNRWTQTQLFDAVDGGGAASLGVMSQTFIASSDSIQAPALVRRKLTPAAGSHVFSWRGLVAAGTGVVIAGAGGAGNFMPGYIRVYRAF